MNFLILFWPKNFKWSLIFYRIFNFKISQIFENFKFNQLILDEQTKFHRFFNPWLPAVAAFNYWDFRDFRVAVLCCSVVRTWNARPKMSWKWGCGEAENSGSSDTNPRCYSTNVSLNPERMESISNGPYNIFSFFFGSDFEIITISFYKRLIFYF
jgi:hypothetical protein